VDHAKMKIEAVPPEPVDERSLSEWRQIGEATGVSGEVDVLVTEEGPRFYLHGGRVYWLAEGELVVQAVERGDELVWRALDATGVEVDAGVCSARWPVVVKGDQPPWPARDAGQVPLVAAGR
jgi:hypothetical protein